MRLADQLVAELSAQPSLGVYHPRFAYETLWNEYCHDRQREDREGYDALWRALIRPRVADLVGAIPDDEAALLSFAAKWHVYGDDWPATTPLDRPAIGEFMLDGLRDRAMDANISAFTPIGESSGAEALLDDDDVDPDPEKWELTDDDHMVLGAITGAVRGLISAANGGDDLIAIGEALEAIRCIHEGEGVEVNVGLTMGGRVGDENGEDGTFVGLRINCEEIILDEMTTTYRPEVGSDNSSSRFAELGQDGGFPGDLVDEWIERLHAVSAQEWADLTTERDHL